MILLAVISPSACDSLVSMWSYAAVMSDDAAFQLFQAIQILLSMKALSISLTLHWSEATLEVEPYDLTL